LENEHDEAEIKLLISRYSYLTYRYILNDIKILQCKM